MHTLTPRMYELVPVESEQVTDTSDTR